MRDQLKILVYGFGNEGLEDDALGLHVVKGLQSLIAALPHAHVQLEQNFQLNAEDAELIAMYDIAIFVDAFDDKVPHFTFKREHPAFDLPSHNNKVEPSYVLALCQQLYNKYPEVYSLRIKGYAWEMKEMLSGPAEINLQLALNFIKELLLIPERRFDLIEERYI